MCRILRNFVLAELLLFLMVSALFKRLLYSVIVLLLSALNLDLVKKCYLNSLWDWIPNYQQQIKDK